jgi:hypothetical protein
MDIESPRFEEYDARFRAIADGVEKVKVPKPSLNSCQLFLFLYGENGLSEADEFEALERFESTDKALLRKMEVETDYWQDIILFLP